MKKRSGKRENEQNIDNVIETGGSEESIKYNRELKSARKKLILTIVTVVLILLAVAGATFFVIVELSDFKGCKVLSTTPTDYDSSAKYVQFADNLLRFNNEGASYINAMGETVWTAGSDMVLPIAETCQDYAVIADKGGNLINIYNIDGAIDSQNMPYEICDVDVSKTGAYVAVLQNGNSNLISMYSSVGDQIYEIKTSIENSGYPMDIAISDDGQKLFTSYLYLVDLSAKINLTAYNFGDVGQNENADRMVGGYTFEDQMVSKVDFLTNDIVAAYGSEEIVIYSMKEKPSEKAHIKYDDKIRSVFSMEGFVGTVQDGNITDTQSTATDAVGEEDSLYLMKVYDYNGNLKFEYRFNFEYDNIVASKGEIIIIGGKTCHILTSRGKLKFAYTFKDTVKDMIPAAGRNTYVVTYEDRIDNIKLTKAESK